MKNITTSYIYSIFLIILMTASAMSCSKPDWMDEVTPGTAQEGGSNHREPVNDKRKVLVLYIAGYNDIQNYLAQNITDLMKGWLPKKTQSSNVLLVYSHMSKSRYDLKTPTEPVLFRLYSDNDNNAVADTIMTYPSTTISASGMQLKNVLTYVKDTFKVPNYGLIFSSHGTGFLPVGYYSDPYNYEFNETMMYRQGWKDSSHMTAVPYVEREYDPSKPQTKSIGQSVSEGLSYEIDLKEFAEALPMKMDYILFDACLMGGIETAYELADKCDRLGFSQAEILADGFDCYTTLTTHLLKNSEEADPLGVCKDYIDIYNAKSGDWRSATISLVDCNHLEPLAEVCRELFEKYRSNIATLSHYNTQRFYTGNHPWFFDLESILTEAGADTQELMHLRQALDDCVLYKGHTPIFLGEFSINTFSGFSMYLPSKGTAQLNRYYKTLKWNQATELVK